LKVFSFSKDGGPDSIVTGLFFVEIKKWFSVVGLRFGNGSREAFHSHAFNAVSWVLKGSLLERHLDGREIVHTPSWKPIFTKREVFHQVFSRGNTYVFSLRGPWAKTWMEFLPKTDSFQTLGHGRKVVG
jgi:hypothetical protein